MMKSVVTPITEKFKIQMIISNINGNFFPSCLVWVLVLFDVCILTSELTSHVSHRVICRSISVLCLCELTCTVSLFRWCWELRSTMHYCLGVKNVGPLAQTFLSRVITLPLICRGSFSVSKMFLRPLTEFVISPVIFFKRPVWFFCLFVCLIYLTTFLRWFVFSNSSFIFYIFVLTCDFHYLKF